MPSITLNISNLVKLSKSPAFSSANLKRHASKLMRKYALEAQRSYVDSFSKERDPITELPWVSRSPAYVRHLMSIGRGYSKILQLSLNLRNRHQIFFNNEKSRSRCKAVLRGHPPIRWLHTSRSYRSKIPARPYLGLDRAARKKIVNLTLDMLHEAITEELAKSIKP